MDKTLQTISGESNQRVTLEIPSEFLYQLVFRQKRSEPFYTRTIAGLSFHFINTLAKGASAWRSIRTMQNMASALKTLAKISRGRIFYYITENEKIIHTGWITLSSCRYYNVEHGDIVIGPIWSSETTRSRGIGEWGTKMAINKMLEAGPKVIFIDTSNNNIPCLKLIDKCDFGAPIASYIRQDHK